MDDVTGADFKNSLYVLANQKRYRGHCIINIVLISCTCNALVTGNPHPGEMWGICGDLQVLRLLTSPKGVGE